MGRLETEEGENAKHEVDMEELNAKHAENQASVATSKILNQLDTETKKIEQQNMKVKAGLSHNFFPTTS